MRILGLIGIGMSLTSAGILLAFLLGSMDRGLLFLAFACSLVVAVYQAVTMYLGYRVTTAPTTRDVPAIARSEADPVLEIRGGATRQLNVPASVVENTTELLDPVSISRDSRKN